METYSKQISKEEISHLPTVTAVGEIVVIDQPEQVDAAVAELFASPVIGFDTETKPSFTKGTHHTISLLQLCTETKCFLFRLQLIGPSDSLKRLLESKEILKIGLSVHDDFRALNKWMRVFPANFIELQKYAPAYGIEDMSLQKMYAIVFGYKISKSQQLSNWEASHLTPAQQHYAAIDAWACREIYFQLRHGVVPSHLDKQNTQQ